MPDALKVEGALLSLLRYYLPLPRQLERVKDGSPWGRELFPLRVTSAHKALAGL